jgi:uncharacterized protein (TIGR02147 family)
MAIRNKKTTLSRPTITEYHDCREFLRDWLEYKRSETRGFSLRQLAYEAKLSVAYLPTVLAGKRTLTEKSLNKIAPHLGLSLREIEFLHLLRQLSETKDPSLRAQFLEKMQRRGEYRQKNPREASTFRYLSHWYYVAIREMAVLDGFVNDPVWISERLYGQVSPTEAKQAMDFLLAAGFLSSAEQGKFAQTDKDLRCEGDVFKVALRHFHHEVSRVSFQSLDESQQDSHFISAHTMAIPRAQFKRVRAILEKALAQIEMLERGSESKEAVVHVTVCATPLTKTPPSREKKGVK